MDLIERQAAIDAVSRGCCELRGIFAECEKNLNELPSAQPEQQWIPCSERLPEEETDAIVCSDKGRRMKMKCPEDIVSYKVICEKFPYPQVRFDTYDLALKWAKMEQPANRPYYIVKCVEKFEILDEVFAERRTDETRRSD